MRRCNSNVFLHSPYLGLQCFWRIDSPFVGPSEMTFGPAKEGRKLRNFITHITIHAYSLMVTTIWTFRSRRYGVVFWQENSLIRQTNRGHGNALKVNDNNLHLFYFINRETYKSSLKLRRCRKGKLCNCKLSVRWQNLKLSFRLIRPYW